MIFPLLHSCLKQNIHIRHFHLDLPTIYRDSQTVHQLLLCGKTRLGIMDFNTPDILYLFPLYRFEINRLGKNEHACLLGELEKPTVILCVWLALLTWGPRLLTCMILTMLHITGSKRRKINGCCNLERAWHQGWGHTHTHIL